jgi:predicted phage tail protein
MKLLLVLLTLSLAVGTVAAATYVVVVIEPAVWSACAIWLSFSAGARIVLGGVAGVIAARLPKPPDQRQVTVNHLSGADRDIVPYDHWR